MATAPNKDVVVIVSLVLSLVSLILLFGVTWYFQSSLDLLQQQVEYDRELLWKLQEQVNLQANMNHDNTIITHDITKRQSGDECQCKDGTPGPRGTKGDIGKEGRKGDVGPPGARGDTGDRGPRGVIGDSGYPGPRGDRGEKGSQGDTGEKGAKGGTGLDGVKGSKGDKGPKGDKGETGLRGDPGDRGPRGLIGDTGLRGAVGETGESGMKGAKRDEGLQGPIGVKGDPGIRGLKGEMGYQGIKGTMGEKGMKGNDRNGGTVYVRWGHDECPPTAELVYSGRVAGSFYAQKGGGSNPQCLPLDPNFLAPISGAQHRALMYGAEYESHTDSNSYLHGRHNTDVPCAVCYVAQRSTVYMLPAKYTCPTGWTREYYGYLMAEYHGGSHHRSQFTCVDVALKPVPGSAANQNGLLFHFTEGRCGSLPCPPYDESRELSCAVCTK